MTTEHYYEYHESKESMIEKSYNHTCHSCGCTFDSYDVVYEDDHTFCSESCKNDYAFKMFENTFTCKCGHIFYNDSENESDVNCPSCGNNYYGEEICNCCGKIIHEDSMISDDDHTFCNIDCMERFYSLEFEKDEL